MASIGHVCATQIDATMFIKKAIWLLDLHEPKNTNIIKRKERKKGRWKAQPRNGRRVGTQLHFARRTGQIQWLVDPTKWEKHRINSFWNLDAHIWAHSMHVTGAIIFLIRSSTYLFAYKRMVREESPSKANAEWSRVKWSGSKVRDYINIIHIYSCIYDQTPVVSREAVHTPQRLGHAI